MHVESFFKLNLQIQRIRIYFSVILLIMISIHWQLKFFANIIHTLE